MPEFKYDRAKRSLEIRLALDDSATYRNVILELRDGIAATDGARLKPWQLTFVFGAAIAQEILVGVMKTFDARTRVRWRRWLCDASCL